MFTVLNESNSIQDDNKETTWIVVCIWAASARKIWCIGVLSVVRRVNIQNVYIRLR